MGCDPSIWLQMELDEWLKGVGSRTEGGGGWNVVLRNSNFGRGFVLVSPCFARCHTNKRTSQHTIVKCEIYDETFLRQNS